MPLTVRNVQPKHLYRQTLPKGVKNELQAVAVYSLAGAIRQISSLAKHAESMLGELCDTMTDINTRTILLDSRVSRLQDDIIPNLDVDEEAEISLMDYLEVEPFKSDQVINQQLLHVQSGPEALTEQYRSCDPKPDLHQFTPLFDNGCNAMSLYSNPDYFFIEWRKSIEREAIIMKITEQSSSTEVVPVVAKPKRPRQRSASHSSTLPTRGRSKERSVPTAIQAFSSVRDKQNKKRRSILKEDTFHHGNSESSGYLSHNSSSTSLDPDGTGSIGSHEGRSLTTTPTGSHPQSGLHVSTSEHALAGQTRAISTISDNGLLNDVGVVSTSQTPNGKPVMLNDKLSGSDGSNKISSSQGSLTSIDSASGRPKVLHKMMRSSSRNEKRDKSWDQQMIEAVMGPSSPRKGSVPVPVISPTKSPRTRRESMPATIVSPGASPEIKRRAEKLLVDTSPDLPRHQRPHSGIFQFPDPLDVLNLSLNVNSFQSGTNDEQEKKVDGFSPDDFPPIDPQLVDKLSLNSPTKAPLSQDVPSSPLRSPQTRQRHQTVSGVIRRPAPSPPTKKASPTATSSTATDQPTAGVMFRPRKSKPSPHVSPVGRRHSIQSIEEESPRTPKRKAPPPPTITNNKSTNLDREIMKHQDKKGPPLERQRSSEVKPPQPSPSTPTSIISTGTTSSSSQEDKTPTNTPNHTPSHHTPAVPNHVKIGQTTRSLSLDTTSDPVQPKRPSLTKAVLYNSILDDSKSEISNSEQPRTHRSKTIGYRPAPNRPDKGSGSNQSNKTLREAEQQPSRGGTSKKHEPPSPAPNQRTRPPSTSGDGIPTPSTPSRFSESDKIADMLRAKAKQRKQKSDEKKKKNTNQILIGAGVNTTVTEERSELLKSIRKGIQLKNVRDQQERVNKQSATMPWDVAAILERRQALATPFSDEGEQGEAVLENEWDDV